MLCEHAPRKIPYWNSSYKVTNYLQPVSQICLPAVKTKRVSEEESVRHHHSSSLRFETQARLFSPWDTMKEALEMEEINPVHTEPRIFIKHCSLWSCYFYAQSPSVISLAYGIHSNFLVRHARSFRIWSVELLQPNQTSKFMYMHSIFSCLRVLTLVASSACNPFQNCTPSFTVFSNAPLPWSLILTIDSILTLYTS